MLKAKKFEAPIIIGILIGLTLRSLVASGLMLIDEGDLAKFSLALCPTQNRGIDFDILRDSNLEGRHHGHGNHSSESESKETGVDTHIHAESFDPACLVWLGSSGDALQLVSNLDSSALAYRGFSRVSDYRLLASQNFIFNGPRGPPHSRLSRSS